VQIKKLSKNILILERIPVLTFVLLGIFVFAVLFVLLSHENQVTLTCLRTTPETGLCKISVSTFAGKHNKLVMPTSNLLWVEPLTNYKEHGMESNILLATTTGMHPLYVFDLDKTKDIADKFNYFIKNKYKKKLFIQQDDTAYNVLYFIIFMIIALSFASLIDFNYVIFDKNTETVSIIKKSLLGTRQKDYEISNIQNVEVDIKSLIKGKKNIEQYRIVLLMKNGKAIPLTPHYSINRYKTNKAIEAIVEFLDWQTSSERKEEA
jgi:hypothetical protein